MSKNWDQRWNQIDQLNELASSAKQFQNPIRQQQETPQYSLQESAQPNFRFDESSNLPPLSTILPNQNDWADEFNKPEIVQLFPFSERIIRYYTQPGVADLFRSPWAYRIVERLNYRDQASEAELNQMKVLLLDAQSINSDQIFEDIDQAKTVQDLRRVQAHWQIYLSDGTDLFYYQIDPIYYRWKSGRSLPGDEIFTQYFDRFSQIGIPRYGDNKFEEMVIQRMRNDERDYTTRQHPDGSVEYLPLNGRDPLRIRLTRMINDPSKQKLAIQILKILPFVSNSIYDSLGLIVDALEKYNSELVLKDLKEKGIELEPTPEFLSPGEGILLKLFLDPEVMNYIGTEDFIHLIQDVNLINKTGTIFIRPDDLQTKSLRLVAGVLLPHRLNRINSVDVSELYDILRLNLDTIPTDPEWYAKERRFPLQGQSGIRGSLVQYFNQHLPPGGSGFFSKVGILFDQLVVQNIQNEPEAFLGYLRSKGILPLPQMKTQYSDVVLSRQFIFGYQEFLKVPDQRKASQLLAQLSKISRLISKSPLELNLDYPELNSEIEKKIILYPGGSQL